ncbi:MAG: calcium-binding EF-hand-containing protein [Streptosporangiaceae bacterium]|jgi:Ca2+-binding EF-hand superfamily protein|nr:calcium-binding EF-hand-containing protein [Streptosporangiaceae bacterium]
MASEFQRSKIAGVFDAMDADGDGFLREADFSALADRWTAIRGVAPGSADHTRLTSIMMGWWATLLAGSDLDRDNNVTLDEVLKTVDQLAGMSHTVTGTAEAMFEATDENGDGRISPAEYNQLIEAWNGCATDTDEIFPLLDLDGDGYLSRDEFVRLWTQFWVGDDPGVPGTWVFGRFELPTPHGR